MKIFDGTIYREETPEEIAQREADAKRREAEYWKNTPYNNLVHAKIRERYSESDEFAISRQRDRKPEEFAEYDAYCEECKAFVKRKMMEVGRCVK